MTAKWVKPLVERAAAPYRAAGRFALNFARGKLGGDPVFAGLLQHGLIPGEARVLDIGCGQGLLASWLLSAQAMHEEGLWPRDVPAPPHPRSVHGIEIMPRDVERARNALAAFSERATFILGDMCKADFGRADVVVILDVLHYVSIAAQDDVLKRVRDALAPNGTLLLRVGDASGGFSFKISNWVDQVVFFARGHGIARLYCRPLADWNAALRALGFMVTAMPMNQGTPFANILLVAILKDNNKFH